MRRLEGLVCEKGPACTPLVHTSDACPFVCETPPHCPLLYTSDACFPIGNGSGSRGGRGAGVFDQPDRLAGAHRLLERRVHRHPALRRRHRGGGCLRGGLHTGRGLSFYVEASLFLM